MVQWLTNQSSNPALGDCFLGGENMNLLFISDIVNLLLKTNSKRLKIPNFVIFVIWSTLIIGGGWG